MHVPPPLHAGVNAATGIVVGPVSVVLLVFAQSSTPPEPEPVSPVVTYAFLIVFFGGIIGVGWYMWKSEKDEKRAQKDKK